MISSIEVADHKEANKPRSPTGEVEIITLIDLTVFYVSNVTYKVRLSIEFVLHDM